MQAVQYRTRDQLGFLKLPSRVRFVAVLWALAMIAYIYLFTSSIKGGEEFIYFQF